MLFTLLLTSALFDITRETASKLHLAWTAHTGATAPNSAAAARSAFESTPVLSGNLLYVTTPYNQVLALNQELASASGATTRKWRQTVITPK